MSTIEPKVLHYAFDMCLLSDHEFLLGMLSQLWLCGMYMFRGVQVLEPL